jgi:hypothetical protein
LIEKRVALIKARDRNNDVAPQFVIEPKLQRLRAETLNVGIDRLRNHAFRPEFDIEQPGRAPRQQETVSRSGRARDIGRVECLIGITRRDLGPDKTRQFEVDAAERAVSVGAEGLCRRAAQFSTVAFDRGEHTEIGREHIFSAAMADIDLAVAAILVDDGAVLRTRGAVVVRIDAQTAGHRQAVELPPVGHVAGGKIVGRRLDRTCGRAEAADIFVQTGHAQIGENRGVVPHIEPPARAKAGVELIEARIVEVSFGFHIGLHRQRMPLP